MAGPFGDPVIVAPPAASESSAAIARRSTGCGLGAPKFEIGTLHMTKLRTTTPDQIWNDDGPTKSERSEILIDAAQSTVQPRPNRRAHRRQAIRLSVALRCSSHTVHATTLNISSGGVLIELERPAVAPGDRLMLDFTVPPSEGVCAYPGTASCAAEVVRVHRLPTPNRGAGARYALGARFLDTLRFDFSGLT